MPETKKIGDNLEILLKSTNILAQSQINEATQTAKTLGLPLERALVMLGFTSEESMHVLLRAYQLVKDGKINLEMAAKSVRYAKHNHLDLNDAIKALTAMHQKTQTLQAAGSAVSRLLLDAQMINQQQLGQALVRSDESKITIGRILVLNRDLSNWMLSAALQAQLLIRDNKISRADAVKALQAVSRRRVSLEQTLFELGIYREGPGQTLRIGEIFQMAGCLTEGDMLECLEIGLIKEKQFGQVLLEQGHATPTLLEAALYLQDMVNNNTMRAYQASEALRNIKIKDVSVYQAVAELNPPPQLTPPYLPFPSLLIGAGIADARKLYEILDVHEQSAVKSGKKLLSAGIINDAILSAAMRVYSLHKEGYLTNESAINVLLFCQKSNMNVDAALITLGLNLPARMQWIWT